MKKVYYTYILKCNDDSFYTGMTSNLERRLIQHQEGSSKLSYTDTRRPVQLVWYSAFQTPKEAIVIEKQIKGWSRRKKIALINEDWDRLVAYSKNYTQFGNFDTIHSIPSSTGSE